MFDFSPFLLHFTHKQTLAIVII